MVGKRRTRLAVIADGAGGDLSAGPFSGWLHEVREAQSEGGTVQVPCGECTACCRSSYFIHVGADEKETLARIPRELQFQAPGQPKGNVVLGYDENGCCPMLVDDECSIYEHRPRACRTYDCRVFPATGIVVDEEDKVRVARRAMRWKFAHPTELDRREQEAVRAVVEFMREHESAFAGGLPRSSTGLANLAIRAHHLFLGDGTVSGAEERSATDREIAEAILEAGVKDWPGS